jgi:hypothetical protein
MQDETNFAEQPGVGSEAAAKGAKRGAGAAGGAGAGGKAGSAGAADSADSAADELATRSGRRIRLRGINRP